MLDELIIHNVILTKEAQLCFAPGFNVITGETGSGKSALLKSLQLLVGGRFDASYMMQGALDLSCEGRFFLPQSELEEESSLGAEELVVLRSVNAEARSRVVVNGRMASLKELQSLIGDHLNFCSQHEYQKLYKLAEQERIFDAWSFEACKKELIEYQEALKSYKEALRKLDEFEAMKAQDKELIEKARYIVRRFKEVQPREHEDKELAQEIEHLEHAEELQRHTNEAYSLIAGESHALDMLNNALESLKVIKSFDSSIENAHETLLDAIFAIEDVSRSIASLRSSLSQSDISIDSVHERLECIEELKRSFGPSLNQVFEQFKKAQELLDSFENSDELYPQIKEEEQRAKRALEHCAEALLARKEDLKNRFEEEVQVYLERLEMSGQRLVLKVGLKDFNAWGASGCTSCEFLWKPGKGLQARPLSRIASGGEMSRVMLALRLVLGSSDSPRILVFDEVDAGIGGSAARAVGKCLQELATYHQVIVVTHLAQIASLADNHIMVRKYEEDEISCTSMIHLDKEDRVRELARMLSGDTKSYSLEHARELLGETQGQV